MKALSITILGLSFLAGCNVASKSKPLLTVDFQKDVTLRYKFVSSRDIEIDLGQEETNSRADKNRADRFTESMEIVVSYTPVEINPYDLTTIKATCESVKVNRNPDKNRSKDAVESLTGKTFTFTVGPDGKIEDYSQLDRLIRETGEQAFRPNSKQGRIKDPDMTGDFIATQWFLWDSVSSIKKAAAGVSVGQSWKSKLSVPVPMIMREARDVVYTLGEIRPSAKGQTAAIRSSYSHSESVPGGWPVPYSGSFQMAGPFGFYRNYKVLNLQGQGEELFNIDKGQTEQYNQKYIMELSASLPFSLGGVSPRITVKQNLIMQLLE